MLNYRLLFIAAVLAACCAALGIMRLTIDTDVIKSLPADEKVIADALTIFAHHPVHDQLAVDIMIDREDPDLLVEIGEQLERKMEESGLFARVGTDAPAELLPPLALQYSPEPAPALYQPGSR